jgi:hypothetical protein
LREQLGRLGGTPFKLGELKNNLSGEVLLPVSELNRLRREVAVELERLRTQPKRWTLNPMGGTGVTPVVSASRRKPGSEVRRLHHRTTIRNPRLTTKFGATPNLTRVTRVPPSSSSSAISPARSRAEMRRDDGLLRI